MDSHTLLNETGRLIQEKKKKLIFLSLIFMLLLLLVQLLPFAGQLLTSSSKKDESKLTAGTANPAFFEVYIEYETGTVFTNTLLLEEAMKTKEIIAGAEAATGVGLSSILAKEEEMNYVKSARDRGALGASRDEKSNIWAVSAKVGTEEENLKVLQYFYDLFANNEIKLLQNKPYYLFSEPRILSDEEMNSPLTPVAQDAAGAWSTKKLLITIVVSIVGGMVAAFAWTLLSTFTGRKINYAFNYSWNEEDTFILLSKAHKADLPRIIMAEETPSTVVLAKEPRQVASLQPFLEQSTQLERPLIEQDILQTDPGKAIKKIILLVQPGFTEKNWYNEQRELIKIYHSKVEVIQVNE